MDKAQDILQAGIDAIEERASFRDANGKKSMDKAVAIFNLLTDRNLSVRDGWEFQSILKKVRSQQGAFCLDDYVDEAAYCALAGAAAYSEVRPSRKGPSVCEDLREDEGDVHRFRSDEARERLEESLVDLSGMSGCKIKKDDE